MSAPAVESVHWLPYSIHMAWIMPLQVMHTLSVPPLPRGDLPRGVTAWQVVLVLAMLVGAIGLWPAMAATAVTMSLLPLTTAVSRQMVGVRKALAAATEERMKLVTEARLRSNQVSWR